MNNIIALEVFYIISNKILKTIFKFLCRTNLIKMIIFAIINFISVTNPFPLLSFDPKF